MPGPQTQHKGTVYFTYLLTYHAKLYLCSVVRGLTVLRPSLLSCGCKDGTRVQVNLTRLSG